MTKHIDYVAYIWIALGVLTALGGLVTCTVITAGGQMAGDPDAAWITGTVGTILGAGLLIYALPAILGGWGLLKRQQWGRVVVIVLSILSLLSIPVGTLIGGYSLWVLFNDDVKPVFA